MCVRRAEKWTSVSPWHEVTIRNKLFVQTRIFSALITSLILGRGLHSSTSQLNLSRFWSLSH